jgi:uncharacterized protein (TIGR03083 family)
MSDPRILFSRAAHQFVAAVRSVPDHAWDRPALGVWSVRELVAHTLRAVSTVEDYLGHDGELVTLHSPAEYYRAVLSGPSVHEAVARRAQEDARALEADPVGGVVTVVERVVPQIDATPLESVLAVRGGTITLANYLPTRILELVVHTDDLCRAIGHQPVATDELVAEVVRVLSGLVTVEHLGVVRSLLGRDGGVNLLS